MHILRKHVTHYADRTQNIKRGIYRQSTIVIKKNLQKLLTTYWLKYLTFRDIVPTSYFRDT